MKECLPKSKRCHNPKGLQQSDDLSANFCAGSVYFVYIAQQRELLAHFAQH